MSCRKKVSLLSRAGLEKVCRLLYGSEKIVGTTVDAAGLLLMTRAEPRKFLLMRHRDRWDLPKGHVEPGEGIREAALRETEEETGIDRQTTRGTKKCLANIAWLELKTPASSPVR